MIYLIVSNFWHCSRIGRTKLVDYQQCFNIFILYLLFTILDQFREILKINFYCCQKFLALVWNRSKKLTSCLNLYAQVLIYFVPLQLFANL